jgi:hypothetical protein
MKKYLIPILSIFTIATAATPQSKTGYIVFYKPYTSQIETNLYTSGPIKFDYNTQFKNVKNANITKDLDLAIKHKDYRFIGFSGNSYVLPGLQGYLKDKNGVLGFGYLKKYEKYIDKYKFKAIMGTSDVINSNSPDLQGVASDYAKEYNKLLLAFIKGHNL